MTIISNCMNERVQFFPTKLHLPMYTNCIIIASIVPNPYWKCKKCVVSWNCTGSLGPAQVHLDLHRFTWNCTGSLGPAQVHLELHRFTWTCTGSLGPAQVHLDLHRLTWTCTGSTLKLHGSDHLGA